MLAQSHELIGCQPGAAADPDGSQHRQQRRQDSAAPPGVEQEERKARLLQILANDRGDQKAGDHEEDVYADETLREEVRIRVKDHDQRHRDGPQCVDVLPVARFHAVSRTVAGR